MPRPIGKASLFALGLSLSVSASCKKKAQPSSNPTVTAPSASATAPGTPLYFEKFIDAHVSGDGIEVAAIMRDRTLAIVTLDANLATKKNVVLASDVEAVEGTDVTAAGGLVVATVKIGGTRGSWLLHEGAAPRQIGLERCKLRDGFAWLEREGSSTVIKTARTSGESASPSIAVPADREAHLTCGATTVALTTRDGENLALTSWPIGGSLTPLTEIEKEGVLDDELRERVTVVRDSGDVVMLRVGAKSVAIRENGDWVKLTGEKNKPFALGEDVDVLEGAASPASKGKVFLLASEPAQGECSDGDPPRRIVLHTIDGTSVSTKPVIELPCGTDAIAVHLTAEAGRARMWWTEPVDAKTCNQAGLPIAAVVTASSDGPAKRTGILAEGVAQIDASRFLAVVRAGGCSPYAQLGNGVLQMLK